MNCPCALLGLELSKKEIKAVEVGGGNKTPLMSTVLNSSKHQILILPWDRN